MPTMKFSINATNYDFGEMPAQGGLVILLEDRNKRMHKAGRAKNRYDVSVRFADGTKDKFIVEASTKRGAKASMLGALEDLECYRA